MSDRLTPVIPALFRCPSCNATGIRYERHDYADEPLGCPDCEGQGIYNVDYAFKIGRLVDRENTELQTRIEWEATIDYEAAVTVLSNYRRLVLMGAEGGFVTTLNELFNAAVVEETP